MTSWPEFIAGFILIGIVLADIFGTVVVPRPSQNQLRITSLLGRGLAPVWRVTNLIRSAKLRQHAKGAFGPFLLVASLVAWIAIMAVGFALMLHSQPYNVAMDDFGFEEALYQSTLALSTLGMLNADINGGARAVVAVAGVCGFSTISLVVAFVISIQNALLRREALVLSLPARAGRPPSATTILCRHDSAALADLFDKWESWCADVWQTHLSYPVLCHFRSLGADLEWLPCLATMLDTAAFVRAAKLPALCDAERSACFLLATGTSTVAALYELMGCRDADEVPIRDTFREMVDQATAEGEQLPRGFGASHDAFGAIRNDYAPKLGGLACKLDIRWSEMD